MVLGSWFDPSLFDSRSMLYGALGNGLYSIFQVSQYLGDETGAIKPFAKKKWFYIVFRILSAAITAFIGTALIIALLGFLGKTIDTGEKTGIGSFVIGITIGFYYDRLIKEDIIRGIFDKFIKKKITDE